jgi:cell fate regulator YaaT (PSP1 superfamily)
VIERAPQASEPKKVGEPQDVSEPQKVGEPQDAGEPQKVGEPQDSDEPQHVDESQEADEPTEADQQQEADEPPTDGAPDASAPVVHGIIEKGPPPQLLEVRFKGKRRDFYTAHVTPRVREREYVVVEADRGQDLGLVSSVGELAKKKCEACEGCNANATPPQRVLRRAAPVDVERALDLRDQEAAIRREVRQMVAEHKLKMKISDAEWQWDRNKLIIYFTADKRVDFRVLVRSLAKKYRTRIELKQIGVRDEAKRLDGVGRCGRELCSSNWLPELKPVTLQLAKDQNLSLNPSQISGACGRLMCSLRFEHDFYVQARKRFPREGRQVRTTVGEETVEAVNIFGNRVTLKGPTGEIRILSLEQLKHETAESRKRARKN